MIVVNKKYGANLGSKAESKMKKFEIAVVKSVREVVILARIDDLFHIEVSEEVNLKHLNKLV